jgi:general L-amino acid transport system permease protein
MLNLVMAFAGITLCFPLGVLLALGRRSKLPLVRWISVGYIELFRGIPLYVLLLLSYLALGLFWPPGRDTPGLVVRAVVAFTLFTAAYVAEIVRGGLQSLPKGQTEAAQALGLSPVKTTFLIVLPQALRNVIPALVGQFISLFKDTTLAAAAMGLLDLFNASSAVNSQPAFDGQRLNPETLAFVMLLFWIGCITMSRESQRLERKLGVGTR